MSRRLVLPLFLLLAVMLLPTAGITSSLDLSKALVIGKGPKTVIEFTDPDCPFCRKAARYFETRNDVTKYVFFLPLARHRDAKNKIQHILSQTDGATAYYEAMSGKLDNPVTRKLQITSRGIRLQEQHQDIAKNAGAQATPTFMISGRIIEGFDRAEIEALLGKQ
ncbi:thioredoxin fold domain-containing protein [Trichlorobacter ammonificans]|uniref:Thiol:disulfide interchange protein DsbC n=1 Tax=Trichlorobacter ammonificans TaxID=2916410 RepID=A0ABM9D7Q9_9BACT|nr:thioredoxin fold domain-containing protein [Trichlorobacter ammonificans]CAH2030426.1 Thiol:disulfide interchange protein DsbC [Trichlorobacter ammonificans]